MATLVRLFGDIDLAEEAVQEAFAVAVRAMARRRAAAEPGRLDRHHRAEQGPGPAAPGVVPVRPGGPGRPAASRPAPDGRPEERQAEVEPVPDDRLRLIFTCCHPALGAEAQLALTLRLVAGLQTPEIARAFLVPEATVRSGWSGPSGRSATRRSPTGCRATQS